MAGASGSGQASTSEFLCTFKTTNGTYQDQHWFECHTCMPSGKDQGICTVCVNSCHKGHDLRYMSKQGFRCDCGKGNGPVPCFALSLQNDSLLCTFKKSGRTFIKQHKFSCITCNLINSEGICAACVNTCHKGHDVGYVTDSRGFFCDCGPSGKCQALTF